MQHSSVYYPVLRAVLLGATVLAGHAGVAHATVFTAPTTIDNLPFDSSGPDNQFRVGNLTVLDVGVVTAGDATPKSAADITISGDDSNPLAPRLILTAKDGFAGTQAGFGDIAIFYTVAVDPGSSIKGYTIGLGKVDPAARFYDIGDTQDPYTLARLAPSISALAASGAVTYTDGFVNAPLLPDATPRLLQDIGSGGNIGFGFDTVTVFETTPPSSPPTPPSPPPPVSMPEPGSLALLGFGLLAATACRRSARRSGR